MLPTDDPAAGPPGDPHDQLRHDLKTPLTTISGHAQLLGRAIRRSPSLTQDERGRMVEALTTIEAAVRAMVPLIDAMGRDGGDGPPVATG
jgi:light-regulated signal transduction histidine kinase (bacteriophytochrome)